MTNLKTRFAGKMAKKLRTDMTDAERLLWSRLRNRGFMEMKFVRQQPVGRFIADFACRQANLIVELDGGQHSGSSTDDDRTSDLTEHGYRIVRFWNNDVLNNLDGVLQTLAEQLAKAPSPGLRFAKPDLSPEGRGEEKGASHGS